MHVGRPASGLKSDASPVRGPFSIVGFAEVFSLLAALATLAGFLGKVWWVFELASHFPLHLALFSTACALFWMVKRAWWRAAAVALVTVVNLALVLAVLLPSNEPRKDSGRTIKLVALNVHTANKQTARVLDYLRDADADVILLMEVHREWMQALSALTNRYALVLSEPRSDNFGIALYARLPATNAQVVYLGDADVPSVTATLLVDGLPITLIGTHPLPPGSAEYARLRNSQLKAIAALAGESALPVIVLGDLNVTPWSPYFRNLLKEADLQNTAQGHGLNASWPAFLPIGRIPLDHCLTSLELQTRARRMGPHVGSDHLPIEVEVGFVRR